MASTILRGVSTSEVPTSILGIVPVQTSANFVVGMHPVHRIAGGSANVNKTVMCLSESDFAVAFGNIDKTWSLGVHAYNAFRLFGTGPHFYVNIFDPTIHKTALVAPIAVSFVGSTIEIQQDIILDSVVVTDAPGTTTYVRGTDYIVSSLFDAVTGLPSILITRLAAGVIPSGASIKVNGDLPNQALVTNANIIGGYDSTLDKYTGLALIDLVFIDFKVVPTIISVPLHSSDPDVAAAIRARLLVSGAFKAWGSVSISTVSARKYSDVGGVKGSNNINDAHLDACWPHVGLGSDNWPLAVQNALVYGQVDAANNNLPFASASNCDFGLQCDRLCLADGTLIKMPKDKADFLNLFDGVVTGLNWINGWKPWGPYTSVYPGNTDPKDCFRACRRMVDFIENDLQLLAFQFIDKPVTSRQIETIRNTIQSWLDYLAKLGALIGSPKFLFRSQDNTPANMVSGIYNFYLSIMPPIPLVNLNAIVSLDVSALNTLFIASNS